MTSTSPWRCSRRSGSMGPTLTVEVVDGCSHWMPEERPDLIADRAKALFRRQ
jgi:pimeloyl-ACP methyl ester carboxylesterase